jgi:hypothetical protein
VVAVSKSAEPSLLDDGKNNSRAADAPINDAFSTDDDDERYDCRHVYQNMEFENSETGETAGYRCGSWDCYCCAHNMRMNLIEELDRLVESRPEMRRLLTLTIDSKVPDAPVETEEQHEYITQRFNALRTELNDEYGDLSYVWIRHEGDENGRPHLHLLVDRYLPQSELSAMSRRVGLGEVVDIRRVNARNAAKYLTSYLGKGTLANLPKGLRRYGSSADIDLAVRGGGGDDESDWQLRMDDFTISTVDGGEPLRRAVTKSDFGQQRMWGGPVPPD